MKQRILFVDDDPKLLQGLRRMLRAKRDAWEMEFALGGEAAVECLRETCYDAIVSDMRMPVVDGIGVLQAAKQRCSTAPRLVLSGQADEESLFQAFQFSHQYVSKPCDAERLKTFISGALASREMVRDEVLRAYLCSLEQLPLSPYAAERFRASLAGAGDQPLEDIFAALANDIGATTKLLQLANSSLVGGGGKTLDVVAAVDTIGFDCLSRIVSRTELFSATLDPTFADIISRVNERAIRIANEVRCLALASEYREQSTVFYSVALAVASGHLALASYRPQHYSSVNLGSSTSERNLCLLEQANFGVCSAQVSAFLFSLWGLPELYQVTARKITENIGENGCYPRRFFNAACAAFEEVRHAS